MPTDRPNVVCILADDLGWRDLGSYGSPFYETPNLDALAQEGAQFTDAYASCPVCSPTRASVMSGQYPARVGVTNYIGGSDRAKLLEPEYTMHLPGDLTALPEALGEAGYRTWHVGKWHLGDEADDSMPTDHGFDENVGGCGWGMLGNGFFSPWDIPTLEDGPEGEYLPDRLTDEAIDLIESHAGDGGGDEPFFLNMCYYAVHIPIEAKAETIEKYERKREALGLDDEQEIEVGERFPSEAQREERIKRRLVQSDPTYAAMVQHLDENVGRLLDALEWEGIAEDTVVVFTSDNGGLATAEGSPTTNRPLAEGKGWMQEGGNRVPLIVRWPGVTDGDDDRVLETPVTSPDVYATALDAAGVDRPADQAVDGESLRPLLESEDGGGSTGAGSLERDAVFWHYPHYGNQGGTPSAAVRQGDWKLIDFFETDAVELYHLDEDVSEARDLSHHRPEKREELHGRLQEWQDEVGAAVPEENPDFEPWPDRAGPG
ncbi:MAG: sulfatase [Halobacteriales archaeon]